MPGLATASEACALAGSMTTSAQTATIAFQHHIATFRPGSALDAIASLKLPGRPFINPCAAVPVDLKLTAWRGACEPLGQPRDSRTCDYVRPIRTQLGSGERLHGTAAGG